MTFFHVCFLLPPPNFPFSRFFFFFACRLFSFTFFSCPWWLVLFKEWTLKEFWNLQFHCGAIWPPQSLSLGVSLWIVLPSILDVVLVHLCSSRLVQFAQSHAHQQNVLRWRRCSISKLPDVGAISHMWITSPWNVAWVTEELSFLFYLIVVNWSGPMWPLHSTGQCTEHKEQVRPQPLHVLPQQWGKGAAWPRDERKTWISK